MNHALQATALSCAGARAAHRGPPVREELLHLRDACAEAPSNPLTRVSTHLPISPLGAQRACSPRAPRARFRPGSTAKAGSASGGGGWAGTFRIPPRTRCSARMTPMAAASSIGRLPGQPSAPERTALRAEHRVQVVEHPSLAAVVCVRGFPSTDPGRAGLCPAWRRPRCAPVRYGLRTSTRKRGESPPSLRAASRRRSARGCPPRSSASGRRGAGGRGGCQMQRTHPRGSDVRSDGSLVVGGRAAAGSWFASPRTRPGSRRGGVVRLAGQRVGVEREVSQGSQAGSLDASARALRPGAHRGLAVRRIRRRRPSSRRRRSRCRRSWGTSLLPSSRRRIRPGGASPASTSGSGDLRDDREAVASSRRRLEASYARRNAASGARSVSVRWVCVVATFGVVR